MSNTFLIGTGDNLAEDEGFNDGSETICDFGFDDWVMALLCPSSKFIESNSNELVSIDIEFVPGTLKRKCKQTAELLR